MPIIPKTDLAFTFGPVTQGKSKRGLLPGELVEAINVRQIVDDEYRKRPGYDRTVPTTDTSSFTTSAESFVFDGKSKLARDGADAVWRLNGSTWYSRGTTKRAAPTMAPGKTIASASNPIAVFDGTNYWVFSLTDGNSYIFSIVDTSGNVVRAPATASASNITTLAAVSDGTYIWVFYGIGTTATKVDKYTIASPGTAATTTTYTTLTKTAWRVDAHVLGDGTIAVAWVGYQADSADILNVSHLDTATGQAKASPAPVVTGIAGNTTSYATPSAPSILTSDGSNGSWYVAVWQGSSTTYTLKLFTVTKSTLATSGVSLGTATANASSVALRAWCCGYLAGNGNRVVYACYQTYATDPTFPVPYTLVRYTYNGSATTTTTIRRYSYPVSKPQAVGSTYYLLTGYDDGPSTAFERSYYLVDSDGNIVTQAGSAQAPPAGLTAQAYATGTAGLGVPGFVTPLRVSGNKLQAAVLFDAGSGGGASGVNDFAPALLSVDFAPTWSAPARLRDGIAAWPNGVPLIAGTSDSQTEIAPLLSPVSATFAAGSSTALAGPTTIQYIYRIVNADGTICRSSPSPAQTQTFNSAGTRSVTVMPLTHLMPGTTAQIELYLSAVSSTQPILYTVIANDTTVDTITTTVTPTSIPTAETIYTYGGGIDNSPAPASKCVALWRNRTFLASDSELWPSLERENGIGPRFSESCVSTWDDGEGEILALAPVDWNYLAIFKRNAIAVVSGGGPTPTPGGGVSGNYEPQTLRIFKGRINPRSVIRGPGGAYFQSLADGRIYCVTPGLEVADVSRGMESYRTGTVQAVNFVERDRQLHFHMDDGSILVLDYAHAPPDQPLGRWVKWSSSGLLAACGALVDETGAPAHLEASTGAVRTQGTGWTDATSGAAAAVLMSVESGDLAASGKLKGSYRLDAVHVLGEWLATNTIKVTVTSDYAATTTTHTSSSITAAPQEAYIRPAGHDRVQSTRLKIEETVSAGEGFVFTGAVLTVQMYQQAKFPSNSRRVS